MFWLKENLILSNVLITGESNFDERNGQEMFNWSEVHSWNDNFLKNPYFSKLAFIHTNYVIYFIAEIPMKFISFLLL